MFDQREWFAVREATGELVEKGEPLGVAHGEEVRFWGVWHPRKVTVRYGPDPGVGHYAQGGTMEYYPSVFGLKIIGPEGYHW